MKIVLNFDRLKINHQMKKIYKKIIVLIFVAYCSPFAMQCFALNGGPDLFGYIWKDSNDTTGPVYNWIDILSLSGATQVKLLGDDNVRGPFGVGFNFHYYWENVSNFWVGSNGYIGFNDFSGGQIAVPVPTIPSIGQPQDYLAIMAADLNFSGPGNPGLCYYWSNGTDTLIVSFINVPFWDTTSSTYSGSNTFQIILSGVDSSITYQYQQQTGTYPYNPQFMSIGIENYSGQIGLQQSYNTYPTANYAIKFYYPSNSTYTVNDASVNWNNNPGTGGIFVSSNGNPFVMTTNIANTGNLPLAPVVANCQIQNISNVVQQQGVDSTGNLGIYQNQTLTLSNNPWQPTLVGRYKFTTTLPTDGVYNNNTLTQEVVVVDTTFANIVLAYDNGVADFTNVSWQGGNGGAGVYFIPPFHPCKISKVSYYIAQNLNSVGFYAKIYKDDGNYNSAGTLLDSIYIDGANVLIGWNDVVLPTPIYISTGGFYVGWYMGGPFIGIGTNSDTLISHRAFELLNSTWSVYRNNENQNFLIRATIEKSPSGINEISTSEINVGNFYPSPATSIVSIDINTSENITAFYFSLFDITGQKTMVDNRSNSISGGKQIYQLRTSDLSSGIYFGEFILNDNIFRRKLVIVK